MFLEIVAEGFGFFSLKFLIIVLSLLEVLIFGGKK